MATLTYSQKEQTAYIGPLALTHEPHSWDLCETHAEKITAPVGWKLVKQDFSPQQVQFAELVAASEASADDELIALAEAVREAGQQQPPQLSGRLANTPQSRRANLRVITNPDL